jgi:ribosomal protein L11 methylase PrmA
VKPILGECIENLPTERRVASGIFKDKIEDIFKKLANATFFPNKC